MQGFILSCKRNPEVGSLGRIWWLHEITREARLLSFYSAVLLMWPLEWPQGHFMAQDGCWSWSHVVCILETKEGKSAEELTPCLLRILPSKRPTPPEVARMWSQGLTFQQERLRSKVVFLLLFVSPASHISRFLSQGRRDFFWGNNQQTATFLSLYAHLFSVSLKQSQIVGGWHQGINISVHIDKQNVPHLVICHAAFPQSFPMTLSCIHIPIVCVLNIHLVQIFPVLEGIFNFSKSCMFRQMPAGTIQGP